MSSSGGADLAIYKPLGAVGVTLFAAVPSLFAAIEPATWADIEARMVYLAISAASAFVVLMFYRPKDRKEAFGRVLGAVVFCLAFVEPIAVKVRPYVMQTAHEGSAPLSAAFPAAVLCGICGWWVFGAIAFIIKEPRRIFRLIDVIRGKDKLQSVLEDTEDADSTNTNGGGHGHPGTSETRTPEQKPEKEEKPSDSALPTTKTT